MAKTTIYPTKRMDELEAKIKVQEEALAKAHGADLYVHAYLLQRLTDEWGKCVERGEVTHADYAIYLGEVS